MKYFLTILFCILLHTVYSQQYTVQNAHSHNDYNQLSPFELAYNENFGSIEADIFIKNGLLLVGHTENDLKLERSLEKLYLNPLLEHYNSSRKLQLLIDIKTEPYSTINVLINILKKYPKLINNSNIKFVLSGNLPSENDFVNYPTYIWFDGRVNKIYTKRQLNKIALISEDFNTIINTNIDWTSNTSSLLRISNTVKKVHMLGKPIRFWASPDNEKTWKILLKYKVDFINTDKITQLADFLNETNNKQKILPYNRIIRSSGSVVRFGSPDLENHAMDITDLNNKDLVVIQDRYGFHIANIETKKIIDQFRFSDYNQYAGYMTIYSGIATFFLNSKQYIIFSGSNNTNSKIFIVEWENGVSSVSDIDIPKSSNGINPLPNQIIGNYENNQLYLYTILNGTNQLIKIDFKSRNILWSVETGVAPFGLTIASNKIWVTNWGGEKVTDTTLSTAGVPWGLVYTDSLTGATSNGSVSVFNIEGKRLNEIQVGLHPNAIISSNDFSRIYISNGSSDEVSIIDPIKEKVISKINVNILENQLQGSTPNALFISKDNSILYVCNGFDNAILVYDIKNNQKLGLVPTEAYPAGLLIKNNKLIVANLESEGANVTDQIKSAKSIHNQLASISIIPIPNSKTLNKYTLDVLKNALLNRIEQWNLKPRNLIKPAPIPVRIGEPSVFKHVVYIIKENKTYDQVFGDMLQGNGDSSLCIFGNRITPNEHALAKQFGLMDNYYASGKSSAEGHQWTDAGMVSDYVEKNIRAWFRSYPHRQADALVYNKAGFIWNHAIKYGKSVKVYGEACETKYDNSLTWKDLYNQYQEKTILKWRNSTTIGNLRPYIHLTYPDCDNIVFSDQQRASIFIEDWERLEKKDSLPNLMILSLPNDHTAGTSPNFPTPNAMVADNDLALGRIVDMITHSKSWDSTVIFVTQDDSQGGWDHISAYRTVGLVISPYSKNTLIHTQYNQVSMLRTIEQILGLPPMNIVDATSRLMLDCFNEKPNYNNYSKHDTNIQLDEMNSAIKSLHGIAKEMAIKSKNEIFNELDGGKDDQMNKIIWFYAKGNKPYPILNINTRNNKLNISNYEKN